MSGHAILMSLLVFFSTAAGMFLAAWISTRGFEKALVETMNDPDLFAEQKKESAATNLVQKSSQ